MKRPCADEVPEGELAVLIREVQTVNPHASRATVDELADGVCAAVDRSQRFALTAASPSPDRSPPFSPKASPKLHPRHELAHEFTGCNVVFPAPVEEAKIVPWLYDLPKEIIRVKVLLKLASDEEGRYLYERVGGEVPKAIPVREIAKVPCSGIFIGPSLDPGKILRLAREHLSSPCYFPD